jgi:hypothetical protein
MQVAIEKSRWGYIDKREAKQWSGTYFFFSSLFKYLQYGESDDVLEMKVSFRNFDHSK